MNNLPLELLEIISLSINVSNLMEICRENRILRELCKKYIDPYINDIGLNGLIFNGDLSGVKYYVETGEYPPISRNNYYAMKWARLCKKHEIEKYLISRGSAQYCNFSIIRNTPEKGKKNTPDYFSILLKPIHIDNIRGIKYIPIHRELKSSEIIRFRNPGPGYEWIYTDLINGISLDHDPANTLIRNLDIKYRDGDTLIDIPLSIEANGQILYEWNSGDTLREIIPIGYSPFVSFQLHARYDNYRSYAISEENYHKFTVNYELGFMPKKVSQFYDHFRFNSTMARYDIPKGISLPIEIFGNQKKKIYNLLHLSSGIIGFGGRYSNYVDELNQPKDLFMDCKKYIYQQCQTLSITYQETEEDSLEKFKRKIVNYGEMCLPYDITPYVWEN
jgi:hypothetical protein